MTSTIAYVTDDAAYLATDGGMFADGQTLALKQKAIILAHQDAVAAARGPEMFAGLLAVVLGTVQGEFDDLAAAFPRAVQQAHTAMLAAIAAGTPVPGDSTMVDALLIGLSEREGFIAYAVASYDDDGVPAFTAKPLRSNSALAYASPMDQATIDRLERAGTDVWAPTVNVEKHALALMREQRASTDIVGGFCQLTTVIRSGVFSSILERWPDPVPVVPRLPAPRAAMQFAGAQA
ncbi:hypothetical protein BZG35_03505 [Brevundimonas sp. LM2]|uniref:hypothetical protein n=1 Tax=Brevundimonas sp. LM2 TaxID=1938605 RepID=UPI000983EBC1|nr:hypothetical protein [Brevundimonas sp. LM2]AQR60822.1 hypothetical protein BZG35_03505 [Brevundimonas sp. LM2]